MLSSLSLRIGLVSNGTHRVRTRISLSFHKLTLVTERLLIQIRYVWLSLWAY